MIVLNNFFLNKYAANKIVGFDKVYVHLALNHYNDTLLTPWVTDTIRTKIIDDANGMNAVLLGKIAPDINMTNIYNDSKISLHQIQSPYTFLVMWDHTCGHCKKSMPKLDSIWDALKPSDIKIMSVCSGSSKDKEKCLEFMNEKCNPEWYNVYDPYYQAQYRQKYGIKSFPKVFILDENKRIIMANVPVESSFEILEKIKESKAKGENIMPNGEIMYIDKTKVYELKNNCK